MTTSSSLQASPPTMFYLRKRPLQKQVQVQILDDESKKEQLWTELARLIAPIPPPRPLPSDSHVASKSNEWIPLDEHQKWMSQYPRPHCLVMHLNSNIMQTFLLWRQWAAIVKVLCNDLL
ncbi:hypothetical protein BDN71DRAFT_1434048 [Pleurotus eryngii]|uniref:Uncharacterized protein n=1 Tax=Pleurotus eryngii TaxID=5323 RepID=A0A9P5ZT30_PLEER|nr:hypothetical protein BDN71DRAFT_1434048 [Pleurotus eryngii]